MTQTVLLNRRLRYCTSDTNYYNEEHIMSLYLLKNHFFVCNRTSVTKNGIHRIKYNRSQCRQRASKYYSVMSQTGGRVTNFGICNCQHAVFCHRLEVVTNFGICSCQHTVFCHRPKEVTNFGIRNCQHTVLCYRLEEVTNFGICNCQCEMIITGLLTSCQPHKTTSG